MTELYARPYNPNAKGFYFRDYEEYCEKSEGLTDKYGNPVEEFEIHPIAYDEDEELFVECNEPDQAYLEDWFLDLDDFNRLNKEEKYAYYYLNYYLGYSHYKSLTSANEVRLYVNCSPEDYIGEFLDDAYDIPESIRYYIDVKAFARDAMISGDIDEFELPDGTRCVVTNAACL